MIKIGISACFLYPDPKRSFFAPKTLTYLEGDMARYLTRKGILPILIPDVKDEFLYDILKQLDGVVFQGGSDVCPESYNEPYFNKERWPGDKYRDKYELKIADFAFNNNIPMLGICRGFQLLNTYFGGTLFQDLKEEGGLEVEHRNAEAYDKIHHNVELRSGGYLAKLYQGKEKICVNSVHHQGVKMLGAGLVADAFSSEDKLIEGFIHKDMDKNFVLAVQWHPEFSPTLEGIVDGPAPIYDDFLKFIKTRRGKK